MYRRATRPFRSLIQKKMTQATAATASVTEDLTEYVPITEASTTILYPKHGAEAFYNPVQEFNRDLTIAVINQWSEIFLAERRAKYAKRENPTSPLCEVLPTLAFFDSLSRQLTPWAM